MSCQPDSDWWKIETPPPTPAPEDQEEEDDEEEEEEKESGLGSDEGELDSVGFIFQTLLDNNASVDEYPFLTPTLITQTLKITRLIRLLLLLRLTRRLPLLGSAPTTLWLRYLIHAL